MKMKKHSYLLPSAVVAMSGLTVGCSTDIPMVNLGIDDTYYIARMQKLDLRPALTGEEYIWSVDGHIVSHDRDYIFLSKDEGKYLIRLEIVDPETPYEFEFEVNVIHEEVEYSPYITKVHEYRPAPGQFINEMPRYEQGDTEADMLRKAEESISGKNDVMISLGGFGGYVTFAFDHTVINVPDEYDLRLWGNCFYELTQDDVAGGSAEPGIVMVSFDRNCNGLPDDEWYELAGSDYFNHATLHDYSITYFKPDSNQAGSSAGGGTDETYIRWTDSENITGYIPKNTFHSQDYYPAWISESTLTFSGTCLPKNGVDESGDGSYYVLYSYPWGYADNHPNDMEELNSFDISWAVDKFGNKVHLPGVDFVRVYTGVNQVCGWLGETSTEICRAQDLHIDPSNYGY